MFSVMTCTDMMDRKQPSCCIRAKKIIAPHSQWRVSGDGISLHLCRGPETLVFLFSITNDDYMAKIDTNNIQVYKGGLNNNQLKFV